MPHAGACSEQLPRPCLIEPPNPIIESPGAVNGSRVVVRICRWGHDTRAGRWWGAGPVAPTTCSQVSRAGVLVPGKIVAEVVDLRPAESAGWSARAAAAATSEWCDAGARCTDRAVPDGESVAAAAWTASLVLPTPPVPASVASRATVGEHRGVGVPAHDQSTDSLGERQCCCGSWGAGCEREVLRRPGGLPRAQLGYRLDPDLVDEVAASLHVASSASTCRPSAYSALISDARGRSRSGCSATSARSSAIAADARPT